ncbi:MAG: polysaccharide deacetylase family protein [Candidatus Acidiferrales bacterium]
MDVLLHHAVPIRADFAAPLAANSRFVCVTFDDGLVSFAECALPELEKRGIPATVFAVSGKLGQPPDWANYSDEPLTTERTMTSGELREISDRALIGSHTATHPMLTKLSETEAARELEQSRKALERLLNRNVTLFSFPYGDFNYALIKWSSAAGYQRVFTTLPFAFASECGAEESVVGRVSVEPTDWPVEFRLKILGAYQWLPAAFAIKRNIRFLLHRNKDPKVAYDTRREHGN